MTPEEKQKAAQAANAAQAEQDNAAKAEKSSDDAAQAKADAAQADKVDEAAEADTNAKENSEAADSLESIKKDLEAQAALVAEGEERYKRLQADFANFRRRNEKERQELSSLVVQGFVKDLLPVVDNFERALAVENAKDAALHEGISMVYKQLMEMLKKNGLEHIKAVGEKFDPNFHQAVMRVQDADKEDGIIEEELQKGYMVQGKVIRPSMVKVVAN